MSDVQREALSALVDGELESSAVTQACTAWRADASLRATWHVYQLTGDVLRSEDLAACAADDADFLAALRVRLADEPVVLAPQRLMAEADRAVPAADVAAAAVAPGVARSLSGAGRRHRRWSWMAPSAVAAGFVAVAGALVVTRGPSGVSGPVSAPFELARGSSDRSPDMSSAAAATSVTAVMPVAAAMPASQVLVESQALASGTGRYLRDARLDGYLAAHKQFAGSSVLGVPSGFLRNAVAEAGPTR